MATDTPIQPRPVAYLHKSRDPHWKYVLTICARPCNGEEFQQGEKIPVTGKREARDFCVARGATPHNF